MSYKKTPRSTTCRYHILTILTAAILPILLMTSALQAQQTSPTPLGDSLKHRADRDVAVTRWMDPSGGQPTTYLQWQAKQAPVTDFTVEAIELSTVSRGAKFCILVNDALYASIQTALDQYVLDLTDDGYDVEMYTIASGTPDTLRAFLQDLYAEGMAGCVFVGDLPIAWYESWCWDDPPDHEQYPCDLFYMDLDGVFTDSDLNGMYDSHTGDLVPEIWMGRLTASTLSMNGADEVGLLLNYFDKNHRYRTGALTVNNRALVYIDDDWYGGADSWSLNVGQAYADRTFVKDRWTTWNTDYVDRLPQNWESILLAAHSWPGGHAFKNPAEQWGYLYNSEIMAAKPVGLFYNLFACSNARYVETDYSAGWYTFAEDYGLVSIGSTKTGSMLNFGAFYTPFGQGLEIGEAFRAWFASQADGGFDDWEECWFYGMTLIGDPTLKLQNLPTNTIVQYDNSYAQYVMTLHEGSDFDRYNVRFTLTNDAELLRICVDGNITESASGRLYIYNSDGTYPTTVIDSVDFTPSDFGIIDVTSLGLSFVAGQEFHAAVALVEPTPGDSLWIYMDDGVTFPEIRSGLWHDGTWKTLLQIYGTNYNLMIRAEVEYAQVSTVTITDQILPYGVFGLNYSYLLSAEGGTPPFTWEITDGELPTGLTLESSTGIINGIAGSVGDHSFTVSVTDASLPPLYDTQPLDLVIAFVCGDVDGSGEGPDIADLVYLVDYMFAGGPDLPYEPAGDADGSGGTLDVADLVWLVDFMFASGPALQCP